MHGGFGFGMGWMWIWAAVLLTVVVLAIRGAVVATRRGRQWREPEDILRARYARGEIDEDEYRSRLAAIRR